MNLHVCVIHKNNRPGHYSSGWHIIIYSYVKMVHVHRGHAWHAVLRIRIRSDPDLFPDTEISPPNPDPDPALVVKKKISVFVQYRAYVYLFTP